MKPLALVQGRTAPRLSWAVVIKVDRSGQGAAGASYLGYPPATWGDERKVQPVQP